MGTNEYTANQDIRDYMADHSVGQNALAKRLGKAQSTINRMLKKELTQKEKDDLLNHIDAIASENKGKAQEEPEVEVLPEEDECPPHGGYHLRNQVPDR